MPTRLGVAARATFRSLHVRSFRLFFAGQLVSQTGTWMTMVAQTLLVLSLTRSGVAVGLLMAAQFLPVLLLGAWAGTIADRSDKRRLLIGLQTGAAVQSAALGLLVVADLAPLPVIYGLAMVQGVLTAFDNPARRAFVVEMVPEELAANAVSLNSTVMTGSRIVGPALAGLLVTTVGYGPTFLIDAVSYGAVIWGLVAMRRSELHPSVRAVRGRGQVRAGLRHVRAEPDLWVPLVMMAMIGTFAFNFQVTMPLLATGPLGGTSTTFTLLLSALSVGALLGALGTARRTEVGNRQVVVAAAAFGVTMAGLALAPGLLVAFPIAVAVGIASIAFMTTCTAIVQTRAAPEYRGRVLALQAMVFLGSTPIGGPFVGAVSDVLGPRYAVGVGALACLGAALWGARALGLGRAELLTRPAPAVEDEPAVTLAD